MKTKIEMNFMETLIHNSYRIADALERIAEAMEKEQALPKGNNQKHLTPKRKQSSRSGTKGVQQ